MTSNSIEQKNRAVSDVEWRHEFLGLLNSIDGFEELVATSREGKQLDVTNLIAQMDSESGKVISRYEKKELVRACQYYNTVHLIEFWGWYCSWLDRSVESGVLPEDFPVFELKNGRNPGSIALEPLRMEVIEGYFYWRAPDKKDVFKFCRLEDRDEYKDKWSGCNSDSLDQLLGRLYFLKQRYVEFTTFLYNRFLQEQKAANSSAWDYYKIHYYLDHLIYISPGGQYHGAVFDKIFFANNLWELEVYFRYCQESGIGISLEGAADFLERQVKYYIHLGLEISVEENAFLNNYRHLMRYDIEREVVVMPAMGRSLHDRLHSELVDKSGIIKGEGCPFVKSKGVSHNAAREVYTHFDNLMLKLLERWLREPLT